MQKYGVSKLLLACKKGKGQADPYRKHYLTMELTEKLISAGKEHLSVSILFMLASNPGVSDIHPRL
jgi:hypothetical protein